MDVRIWWRVVDARIGWRVHGWRYPVVWWARRKPRSHFRQSAWDIVDRIDWHLFVRPRIRKALEQHNRGDIR